MPPMNPKNMPISPAASDLGLGLGDQLKNQMEMMDEERKKKLLQMGGQGQQLAGSAASAALGIGGF